MSEVIKAWNLIDRPDANGQIIGEYWNERFGSSIPIEVTRKESEQGSTDVVHWTIPGNSGKISGGQARGITVVGRLGGVGARPAYPGTVSDADGAVVAIAVALKLSQAHMLGEPTIGDVHVVTHVCPDAAVKDIPIEGQMRGPVPSGLLLEEEGRPETDALLSIDTTRGHRIANHTGISITPTLMRGYLLRVSDNLLDIYSDVTNELPHVLPITIQDIFPGDGQFY